MAALTATNMSETLPLIDLKFCHTMTFLSNLKHKDA